MVGVSVFHVDKVLPQLVFLAAQMDVKHLVWVSEDKFLLETKTLRKSSIISIVRIPSRGLGPVFYRGSVDNLSKGGGLL